MFYVWLLSLYYKGTLQIILPHSQSQTSNSHAPRNIHVAPLLQCPYLLSDDNHLRSDIFVSPPSPLIPATWTSSHNLILCVCQTSWSWLSGPGCTIPDQTLVSWFFFFLNHHDKENISKCFLLGNSYEKISVLRKIFAWEINFMLFKTVFKARLELFRFLGFWWIDVRGVVQNTQF